MDCLVGMGSNLLGGMLNTYPVRPHLLQTESCYCTTLLLEEGPALEGLRHSASAWRENTNTFLRKERAFFILMLQGITCLGWRGQSQCEAARHPRCLPSIITVNQQHLGHGCQQQAPAASFGGDRRDPEKQQLLVPA